MDYKFKIDDVYISSGFIYGFKLLDYNHSTADKSFDKTLRYELDRVYPHDVTDALFTTSGSRGVKIYKDGITTAHNENISVYIGVQVSITEVKAGAVSVNPALRNIVDDYADAAKTRAGYHIITTAE